MLGPELLYKIYLEGRRWNKNHHVLYVSLIVLKAFQKDIY